MSVTKYQQEGIVSKFQTGVCNRGFSSSATSASAFLPNEMHWQTSYTQHNGSLKFPSGWWIVPCIGLGLYTWFVILNSLFGLMF
jgi:hypothetical protein